MTASLFDAQRPKLLVCVFLNSRELARSVQQGLSDGASGAQERYAIVMPESDQAFFLMVEQQRQQLDCLVLQNDAQLPALVAWLHNHATLLPIVILDAAPGEVSDLETQLIFLYHSAEARLALNKTKEIAEFVDRAIDQFLDLSPSCHLPNAAEPDLSTQNFLLLHQRRLSEKLRERLDYARVYYKRDPRAFLRQLSQAERAQLLARLRDDYRGVVLSYFVDDSGLNQRIDNFVNTVFFADIPVAQIVETHMELMDEFAKQLKLEGRSEEILLDYRLTLIDKIAHLCEMYRRSIPRVS